MSNRLTALARRRNVGWRGAGSRLEVATIKRLGARLWVRHGRHVSQAFDAEEEIRVITIALHTGRTRPKFEWFFDSLKHQKGLKRVKQIIIVDFYAQACDGWTKEDVLERREEVKNAAGDFLPIVQWVPPKPTIWQGPHRVTRDNHWAMSNARNTSICLCRNEWLVMLDDRCVLEPGYITAVKRAISGKFILFGGYQKHHDLIVRDGRVVHIGTISGKDNRLDESHGRMKSVGGGWAYGCSVAAPLEWLLQVNGYPELADGLSFEDVLLGSILEANGFPMKYDPHCRVTQDRTPSEMDNPFIRNDKGELGTTNDKSHKSLEVIGAKKRSEHEWDLRQIRADVLSGKPFPIPSNPDPRDWFDQTPIRGL